MAKGFSHVEHVHARACVAQMGSEHYALIISALLADAQKEQLDILTMNTLPGTDGQRAITFKYKTATTSNVLNDGDWFVMFESGDKVAMSNTDYETTFIPMEGAFTEHAICDETQLAR